MHRRTFLKTAALPALPMAARTARPNVILIALDQLRAGRTHAYGSPRPTTPELDRMAEEGVTLTNFYSASPWTTPSYASILTSQYPSRHGATLFHPRGAEGLRPDTILAAELFKKAGYRTGAFINNSNAGRFLTGRGFDHYDEAQRRPANVTERTSLANAEFRAPATTDRVLSWLDRYGSEPFFLFLLYFEPHSPYDPPPEHDLFRTDAYPEESNTGYDLQKGRLFRKANLGDRKAVERLVGLYDGKIHFVDHHIGRLLQRLRQTRLNEKTIVLLLSDHGELLYSHPGDYLTFDHRSLYHQVMHVPGLLWGADIPKGKRVDSLTHHLDVVPTLLDLAGLPANRDAQGRSLTPLLSGSGKKLREHVFGEQDVIEPIRSVQTDRWKLIWNRQTGERHLYDRKADPDEQSNVAARHPGEVAKLGRLVESWSHENDANPAERERKWRDFASKSDPQLIIDEVTIGSRLQLTGAGWQAVDGADHYGGGAYWAEGGQQGRTATWRPDNPLIGRYRVSVWYGRLADGGGSKNTPFVVAARAGSKTFELDQSAGTGGWRELGEFEDPLYVRLSGEAAGRIIADAVRFVRS